MAQRRFRLWWTNDDAFNGEVNRASRRLSPRIKEFWDDGNRYLYFI